MPSRRINICPLRIIFRLLTADCWLLPTPLVRCEQVRVIAMHSCLPLILNGSSPVTGLSLWSMVYETIVFCRQDNLRCSTL